MNVQNAGEAGRDYGLVLENDNLKCKLNKQFLFQKTSASNTFPTGQGFSGVQSTKPDMMSVSSTPFNLSWKLSPAKTCSVSLSLTMQERTCTWIRFGIISMVWPLVI